VSTRPAFCGGRNIAMKVPPHQLEATIAFYRDVLGLKQLTTHGTSRAFRFGDCCLWVDPAPQLAQAEIWIELQSDDLAAAADHLAKHDVVRCDRIERLPDGFKGFWIANPVGIVHLVAHPSEDPGL
jgi:catechol 2,3-dioxygenase-like lactoylglutathione lyase family enzyme